jgi:hypothetical protein
VKNKLAACCVLFVAWSLVGESAGAAEDIILRTSVIPEKAWVGQKVVLHIEVLAKDGWAQLKKASEADVDGAYLLRLESQGTRLNESIDGDSYTGQRYEFMLFAQRDGKITVPPASVDVEIKTWGSDSSTRIERMTLPSVEFVARTPPGAEGISGLISTGNLTASQTWQPETDSAAVGDAIKRTITLRADDVSGMAFAPSLYSNIENLGIYPGEPTVDDRFARGDLTGTRVETVTYVFERGGDFDIPGIEFTWWNTGTEELRTIVLAGLNLQVADAANVDSAASQQVEQQLNKRLLWSALIALSGLGIASLFFGRRAMAGWTAWRRARNETEAAYFRRIRSSARSGDQVALLSDTMRWLDRINDSSQAARLDLFLQKYGESGASAALSDKSESGGLAFLDTLTVARKRWQQAQSGEDNEYSLPNLNG